MPRRRIPAEEAAGAAARLAAVVHAVRGGWVPPEEEGDAAAAQSWAPDPSVTADRAEEVPARGSGPDAAAGGSLAGAAPAGALGVVAPRVLCLDPGRRGVLALALVAVVAACVAGFVVLRGRPQEVAAPVVDRVGSSVGASPAATGEVVVSVGGKVRRPGLVRLPAGSRVDDAVRAAGGATAGVGLLNLARRLVDGEQVLVGVAGDGVAGTASGLLDLNAATADQLDGLPGIGPVLAGRIVDWRTEHGRFASVDQLREVPGIGESKYLQVKSKVTV